MLIGLFGALLVISTSLAYAGLVKGELSISRSSAATGAAAKVIGGICALISLGLIAGIIAIVIGIMNAK